MAASQQITKQRSRAAIILRDSLKCVSKTNRIQAANQPKFWARALLYLHYGKEIRQLFSDQLF